MRTMPGPATRPVPWMTSSPATGALAAGDRLGDGPAVSSHRPAVGTANQSATAAKTAAALTGRSDPARSTATTTRSVRKDHSSSASDEFEKTRGQSQARPAASAAAPSITASVSVPNCHARNAKPAVAKAAVAARMNDTRRVESRALKGADAAAIRERAAAMARTSRASPFSAPSAVPSAADLAILTAA